MQQTEQWNASLPIREEVWDDFQKQRRVVFDQLAYLRTALYLLREVASFPFDEFVAPDDRIFFTVAGRALYETAVLAITKLTTDEGDVLTVNRFATTSSRCSDLTWSSLFETSSRTRSLTPA